MQSLDHDSLLMNSAGTKNYGIVMSNSFVSSSFCVRLQVFGAIEKDNWWPSRNEITL